MLLLFIKVDNYPSNIQHAFEVVKRNWLYTKA